MDRHIAEINGFEEKLYLYESFLEKVQNECGDLQEKGGKDCVYGDEGCGRRCIRKVVHRITFRDVLRWILPPQRRRWIRRIFKFVIFLFILGILLRFKCFECWVESGCNSSQVLASILKMCQHFTFEVVRKSQGILREVMHNEQTMFYCVSYIVCLSFAIYTFKSGGCPSVGCG